MELKPCPFCGGEANTLIVPDLTYVFCKDCCVEISRRWSDEEWDNPRGNNKIPFDCYQPSEGEYLLTYIGYGSRSGSDKLLSIQSLNYGNALTERQLTDYMKLCEDIVSNTIRPYNYGWRNEPCYDPCEEAIRLNEAN